jgi:hypothetical protein
MKAIRTFVAAACLCAAGIAPALAQGTTFQNGTFDANATAGWQSYGDVLAANERLRLTTASLYDDDIPGQNGFNNQSGVAAVDFFASPDLAGIPVSAFDLGGYAYEGSAVRQDFTANAGDLLTVTFNWAFLSTDTVNPDFGFVALNDSVFKFVDTTSSVLNGVFLGTFADSSNVNWSWYQSTYTYQANSSGTVSLALGVVDVGDVLNTSELRIDNVVVSAVPEPETYAMLLAGLGLLGGYARRRNKQQQQQATQA